MRAIRMVAWAETRQRWGSIVVLTLLVGFVGTVVIASAAGARRTASSLERFEAVSSSADVEINAGFVTDKQIEAFRASEGVAEVAVLRQLALVAADGSFLPIAGQLDDRFGRTVDQARVITGRRAHAADELTIGESLATRYGLAVGDRIEFGSYTPEQFLTEIGQEPEPEGRHYSFEVVGIVRRPLDLGGRGAKGGVIVPTEAFTRAHLDEIASFSGDVLRVRTRDGAADVPGVVKSARRIFGGSEDFSVTGLGIEGQGAQSAIDVTTFALWVLAGVAALAGLVAIGLALTRQVAHAAPDQDALRAIGLGRRSRVAAAAMGAVPIALVGAALALIGAVAVSPLFPIGVARDAEPGVGVDVDTLALALGYVGMAGMVVALGVLAAEMVTRVRPTRAPRPAMARAAAAQARLSPVVATGVGFALERGRGRSGVPLRSSLVGAVAGVVGAVAALTFAASLHHVAVTPRLYGWPWDYLAFDGNAPAPIGCDAVPTELERVPVVDSVAQLCIGALEIRGHPVTGFALAPIKGDIEPSIVEGRAPSTSREIALGADTLAAAGKEVGESVDVVSETGRARFRIVGQTLGISLDDPAPLADAAVLTPQGLQRSGGSSDTYFAVGLAPGTDRARAVRELAAIGAGRAPQGPTVPVEVDRIRQIDAVPIVLAGFVATVAIIAVGYALVIGIRRRRRDLAILKTLGFARRQVRASVAWQATTLAVLGVVIGVPLGIVVGRVAWRLVAESLGIATTSTVPVFALVAVAVAAVLLANVIAWLPARAAARTRPAVVLRSE